MVLSLVVRAALWWGYRGFSKGDDVEILEAALRYGAGLGHVPWEIRNDTLPLLLAPISRLLLLLGVSSRDLLVDATVVPFLLVGTLNIFLTFELARRWFPVQTVPWLASVLYGFHWILLVYSSAPFPRVFATSAVLGAAVAVSDLGSGRSWASAGRALSAGALLGLAFSFRYSEALFLVPLAATPFVRRHAEGATRIAGLILTGFILSSLLFVGVVDWLTRGVPFASLLAFLDYTLVERASSSIEANQPFWWYLKRLLHWLPVTALPLLFFARRDRATAPLWLFAIWPLMILSLIHHKELRYLQTVWPFVAILVASGADVLFRRGRRLVAWSLVLVTILLGASRTSMVQKRSLAALSAAHHLQESTSGAVALSQSWAYGNRLFLDGRRIFGLGLPPTEGELRTLPGSVQAVGVDHESLDRSPRLREVLVGMGFCESRVFRRSRSEPVVLFVRAQMRPERGAASATAKAAPE
jgi:hypothetical protein